MMLYWFWWLLTVAISFAVPEFASRFYYGDWKRSLSDTVRNWQTAHHWIAPIVWGGMTWLMVHFFVIPNTP